MDCACRFESPPLRAAVVFLAAFAAVFSAAGPCLAAPSPEAAATVVVYNSSDPDSVALAKHYALRREIPGENLVGLAVPVAEEISRTEYRTLIAAPLRAMLLTRGFWSEEAGSSRIVETRVRFLALIRGMPLKIRPDETLAPDGSLPEAIGTRNEASVDSELMALSLVGRSPAGLLPNPYFRRYTPVLNLQAEPDLLLVARLDAPDAITVRAMIDDAVSTERDGLWGWGYVDARGILKGTYAEGDRWLVAAMDAMRKQGIPVMMDSSEQTLPAGFPVTDAAVYYGWYSPHADGPFADPLLRFRPGAVAAHIHSFSAATLRSTTQGWCGPLLLRGAAATVGNVYEPYLTLTADLHIMQDRLMAGFTFAESAWAATKAVSWMSVVIGDPIYRPYRVWTDPGHGSPAKPSTWERYRSIIRANGGDVLAAASDLRSAARETRNSMFLEALACVQVDAGDKTAALRSIGEALKVERRGDVRFRLGLEEYALLRAMGDTRAASRTLSRIAAEDISPKARQLLATFYDHMNPETGPTPSMR
jgi:uncharacterized protein (TIGR03790 family)